MAFTVEVAARNWIFVGQISATKSAIYCTKTGELKEVDFSSLVPVHEPAVELEEVE